MGTSTVNRERIVENFQDVEELFADMEQIIYEASLANNAVFQTVERAESGKELFDAFKALDAAVGQLKRAFDNLDNNLTIAGKSLDPLFKVLDGKKDGS